MTTITVPRRHHDAFVSLTALQESAIQQLVERVESSDHRASSVEEIVSDTAGSSSFEAILALNATRLLHGMSARDALREALDSVEGDVGRADLSPLLESPTLIRLAKSADLESSVERSLHLSRVLTDLRPVFNEDAGTDIEAVLISQTLQLVYLEDGRYKELYIALDRSDLQQMGDQVSRALTKYETAERFVQSRGAVVVTEGGDNDE